jgi:hypothetical protein
VAADAAARFDQRRLEVRFTAPCNFFQVRLADLLRRRRGSDAVSLMRATF